MTGVQARRTRLSAALVTAIGLSIAVDAEPLGAQESRRLTLTPIP